MQMNFSSRFLVRLSSLRLNYFGPGQRGSRTQRPSFPQVPPLAPLPPPAYSTSGITDKRYLYLISSSLGPRRGPIPSSPSPTDLGSGPGSVPRQAFTSQREASRQAVREPTEGSETGEASHTLTSLPLSHHFDELPFVFDILIISPISFYFCFRSPLHLKSF